MTTKSLRLHKQKNTHLYDGEFEQYAAEALETTGEVLVAAPTSETATAIAEKIWDEPTTQVDEIEIFTDGQADIPYQPDSFSTAVHYNPGRGILQRHNPLYEMVAAVQQGGTIIYRAPNYIAQSAAATLTEIQILDWGDSTDPIVAAQFDVTVSGDPRNESHLDSSDTTLTDFQ